VQRRIAEDGIELALEAQSLAVTDAGIEPSAPRCRHLIAARIHANHVAAGGCKPLRQRPVAAAEVEDPLTGPRLKQGHDLGGEVGHIACV